MTTKAFVTWNEKANRYELHIDKVLKAYSNGIENAQDTRESHKEGLTELCSIAKENGYNVIQEPYKADAKKEKGE